MQISFSYQLLQAAVLFLKLLESLRVMDLHSRVFASPAVERLLADLMFPANLKGALGSFALAQDLHNLFGVVSFLFRGPAIGLPG